MSEADFLDFDASEFDMNVDMIFDAAAISLFESKLEATLAAVGGGGGGPASSLLQESPVQPQLSQPCQQQTQQLQSEYYFTDAVSSSSSSSCLQALTPPEAPVQATVEAMASKVLARPDNGQFQVADDSIRSFLLSQTSKSHSIKIIDKASSASHFSSKSVVSQPTGRVNPTSSSSSSSSSSKLLFNLLADNPPPIHANNFSSSNNNNNSSSSSSSSNLSQMPKNSNLLIATTPVLKLPTTTTSFAPTTTPVNLSGSSLAITPADSPATINNNNDSSSSPPFVVENHDIIIPLQALPPPPPPPPPSSSANSVLIQRLSTAVKNSSSSVHHHHHHHNHHNHHQQKQHTSVNALTISPPPPPPAVPLAPLQSELAAAKIVSLKARHSRVNVTALKLVPIQGEKRLLHARSVTTTESNSNLKTTVAATTNTATTAPPPPTKKNSRVHLMPIVFTAMPNGFSSAVSSTSNSNNNKKVSFTVISQSGGSVNPSSKHSHSVLNSINEATLHALLSHMHNKSHSSKHKLKPQTISSTSTASPHTSSNTSITTSSFANNSSISGGSSCSHLDELDVGSDWPMRPIKHLNSEIACNVKSEPPLADKFDFINEIASSNVNISNNHNNNNNSTNIGNMMANTCQSFAQTNQSNFAVSYSNQVNSLDMATSIDFLDDVLVRDNGAMIGQQQQEQQNTVAQNGHNFMDMFDPSAMFGGPMDCLVSMWN